MQGQDIKVRNIHTISDIFLRNYGLNDRYELNIINKANNNRVVRKDKKFKTRSLKSLGKKIKTTETVGKLICQAEKLFIVPLENRNLKLNLYDKHLNVFVNKNKILDNIGAVCKKKSKDEPLEKFLDIMLNTELDLNLSEGVDAYNVLKENLGDNFDTLLKEA